MRALVRDRYGLPDVLEVREVPKPPRMTFEQAAALPQAGQLAVQALRANGPLEAGQTILINGGGGGVGTIGVQIAKASGADVTGVDRASKHDMMRAAGFDHVIDYEQEDFTRTGRRYDLIVDTKTSRSPSDHMRAVRSEGKQRPGRAERTVRSGPAGTDPRRSIHAR